MVVYGQVNGYGKPLKDEQDQQSCGVIRHMLL